MGNKRTRDTVKKQSAKPMWIILQDNSPTNKLQKKGGAYVRGKEGRNVWDKRVSRNVITKCNIWTLFRT